MTTDRATPGQRTTMFDLGRVRVLPTALLALLFMAVAPAAAQGDNIVNFDDLYPKGALDCLYDAADSSKCKSKTVPATNSCFCRNGGNFITKAAACIGKSSSKDLKTVYNTLKKNCDNSETPLSVSEKEFMAAAEGDSTTTSAKTSPASTTSVPSTTITGDIHEYPSTTATATTTAPASTSSSAGDDGQKQENNMSTGTIVGIAAGVSIAGVGFLAALAWFLVKRRKKGGEESHPMLPQQSLIPAVGLASARSSTAYYGASPPDTGGWPPKKDWGASPDPSVANRGSMFAWESPAHFGMIAPSPPMPQMPIQELDGAQQFATGTAQAPAEMGGSPVVASPPQPPGQFAAYQPGGQQQPYPGHPAWQQR